MREYFFRRVSYEGNFRRNSKPLIYLFHTNYVPRDFLVSTVSLHPCVLRELVQSKALDCTALSNVLTVVKGSGRGGQHQQRPALGEEGDFAVHASVYGKVQAEPNVNPNAQEKEKDASCLP
jgi:hypothetical protein